MTWLDAPKVSGLYWAYAEGKSEGKPSLCRVTVISPERWNVTFLGSVVPSTYSFSRGRGWLWRPCPAPSVPKRRTSP
jgi:hypothetical protein